MLSTNISFPLKREGNSIQIPCIRVLRMRIAQVSLRLPNHMNMIRENTVKPMCPEATRALSTEDSQVKINKTSKISISSIHNNLKIQIIFLPAAKHNSANEETRETHDTNKIQERSKRNSFPYKTSLH